MKIISLYIIIAKEQGSTKCNQSNLFMNKGCEQNLQNGREISPRKQQPYVRQVNRKTWWESCAIKGWCTLKWLNNEIFSRLKEEITFAHKGNETAYTAVGNVATDLKEGWELIRPRKNGISFRSETHIIRSIYRYDSIILLSKLLSVM